MILLHFWKYERKRIVNEENTKFGKKKGGTSRNGYRYSLLIMHRYRYNSKFTETKKEREKEKGTCYYRWEYAKKIEARSFHLNLICRRLHGLKPEFDPNMLTEKMELETETVNVKTIREYKESYDETDLSGINIPIHVDGTYHG